MKVSIVIPAYNEEKYIEKTLAAALAQDYYNFEVIVVDNNSTDKTAEIVRKFPEARLVQEKNQGLTWARERGRLEAKGSIIANLDADCIPPKDWVRKSVKYFENKKVVAVTGPYSYYDGKLYFRVSSKLTQKLIYSLVHLILHDLFRKGTVMIGGNNFVRVEALQAIGGFNTKIKFYGEDTDLGKRLLKVGKIKYLNEIAIPSSARRFKNKGVVNIFFKYVINHFWMTFLGRPFSV